MCHDAVMGIALGRRLVTAIVVAAVVSGASAARAQSQPALAGFAVLGIDLVRIGSRVRVARGAVGATTGAVRLAQGARVSGSVVAPSVRAARGVDVGRLFCQIVSGGVFGPGVAGGPTVGGSPIPGCRALATPIVDPALLAPAVVSPGAQPLRVAPRSGTAPMAPGAWADVVVGRGSLLQLAGGTYQMRSLRLARSARVVCLDDCVIGVADRVRLGARAQLGAASGLGARRARLDIAAGTTTRASFRAAAQAVVAATVFAPAGAIVLGPRGTYRGAVVGRTVTVRPSSRIAEDSAFQPPARQS